MRKILWLVCGIAVLASACSKDDDKGYNPVKKVTNVDGAQNALEEKASNPKGDNKPITVEMPALTGESQLQIPENLNGANTPAINLKTMSGFESFTVSDKNAEKPFDGVVNIETSSDNTGNLTIDLPGATVTVNGKFPSIAGTAVNRAVAGVRVDKLVIAEQGQVESLVLASGVAEVYGTLNMDNVTKSSEAKILKSLLPTESFGAVLSVPGYDGAILRDGIYSEAAAVQINRPFIIYGPNRGINPNTQTRKAEAVVSIKFEVNTDASNSGDVIVDGLKFTGDTYIILNKNVNYKHKESKVLNCIIENTSSKSNAFFYVWMPAEKIEFSYNKVSNVAMNSEGKGDNTGIIIWRTDDVKVIGNTFNRDSATSGMTSNAALDISANDQNSGDDVINSLVVQNNYVGTGLCVKFAGDVYPIDDVTGNTFAGGRGERGCFVLFKRDFTEVELATVTASNIFLDDSAVRKKL